MKYTLGGMCNVHCAAQCDLKNGEWVSWSWLKHSIRIITRMKHETLLSQQRPDLKTLCFLADVQLWVRSNVLRCCNCELYLTLTDISNGFANVCVWFIPSSMARFARKAALLAHLRTHAVSSPTSSTLLSFHHSPHWHWSLHIQIHHS